MLEIRTARIDDAAAIQQIYAPFVASTPVSFEDVPPTVEETTKRLADGIAMYPWLIAEIDGEVAGFAYACAHRARACYRWSVDTSIYLGEGHRGRGIGRELYGRLIEILRLQGFYNAFAGITLPNPGSIGLHLALGYRPMALYDNVGFKLGRWHSVQWLALPLREPAEMVEEPIPFSKFGI